MAGPDNMSPPVLAFMNIANTITHLCIGALTIYAFLLPNSLSGSSSLKQHIYLCVSGYIILMSQAVLTLSPHTTWTRSFNYDTKKSIHWIMQVVGSILALTGSIIRISNVSSHFSSAHGIFGIMAMILTFLSLIGGVLNLFSSELKMNPKVSKIAHSCFGSLTLFCAYFALIFGFDKYLFRTPYGTTNTNLAITFAVFSLVGTVVHSSINAVMRISR